MIVDPAFPRLRLLNSDVDWTIPDIVRVLESCPQLEEARISISDDGEGIYELSSTNAIMN